MLHWLKENWAIAFSIFCLVLVIIATEVILFAIWPWLVFGTILFIATVAFLLRDSGKKVSSSNPTR
jgi:hypothetical protein